MDSFETINRPKGPTSVALGIFDGMHEAHRAVVSSAAKNDEGLEPWVFTFAMDSVPSGKKNSAFLISKEMKYRLMRGCGIAHVFAPSFSDLRDLTAEEFVYNVLAKHLRAKEVCCGYDFRCGKGAVCDTAMLARLCREHGISLTVVGEQDAEGLPISSTRIRAAVAAGDMAEAELLAGYPFVIDSEVVGGNHIGRLHGLATINQPICEGFASPLFGVYASAAFVDGRFWPAVTNVGVKPTVSDADIPAAETHLLGYSGDLYGMRPPVFLLKHMRPEQRFPSQQSLFDQIAADARDAEVISTRWIEERGRDVRKLFLL